MSDYESLVEKYKEEFPNGTPLVVACEKGRLDDVEALIRVARATGKNVREIVNAKGDGSNGYTSYTPLIAAVQFEHSSVVSYLLTLPEVDIAITNNGWNALNYAANSNKTTDIVKKLLNKMKLEDINHKDNVGNTPLDRCFFNHSPLRQEIIDLMRSKGAKRASELSGSSTVEEEVVHEGTKTVDEQLAEQLKKAEENGDVIDLTDAHESVNDQLHKHATPSDQSELNKTLEKIKQLEDERKKINNELKKLRRRASRANEYPKDGSTNKRQRIKLLDAMGELKF